MESVISLHSIPTRFRSLPSLAISTWLTTVPARSDKLLLTLVEKLIQGSMIADNYIRKVPHGPCNRHNHYPLKKLICRLDDGQVDYSRNRGLP